MGVKFQRGTSAVALLIVGLVLAAVLVGGYVFLSQKGELPRPTQLYPQPQTGEQVENTSDNPEDIQKDIDTTSFSDIDTDVTETETNLNASY